MRDESAGYGTTRDDVNGFIRYVCVTRFVSYPSGERKPSKEINLGKAHVSKPAIPQIHCVLKDTTTQSLEGVVFRLKFNDGQQTLQKYSHIRQGMSWNIPNFVTRESSA